MASRKAIPGAGLEPARGVTSGDFESNAARATDYYRSALPGTALQDAAIDCTEARTCRRTRTNALPLPLKLGGGNWKVVA